MIFQDVHFRIDAAVCLLSWKLQDSQIRQEDGAHLRGVSVDRTHTLALDCNVKK